MRNPRYLSFTIRCRRAMRLGATLDLEACGSMFAQSKL
jgi:hypothetical protein